MSKPLISVGLLATGAVVGFAYHTFTRKNHTVADPKVDNAPAWERRLHKAASLPWHYLHPAGQLVTNENLDSVLTTLRRARQGWEATAPSPAAPAAEPEVPASVNDEKPEDTTAAGDVPHRPTVQLPINYQETVRQVTTQAEKIVRRYQDDPEFRANVQQATEVGSALLKNLRNRTSGRPGGPRA